MEYTYQRFACIADHESVCGKNFRNCARFTGNAIRALASIAERDSISRRSELLRRWLARSLLRIVGSIDHEDVEMNAIQLLKEDHKKVRGLLAELEATTRRAGKKRSDLLASIAREIEMHTRIEEEIFYPAFREAGEKADDDKLYFEALEEHRAAGEMVLPDLQRTATDSDQFSGRAKVLKELIEHHADEEEREMFPRARQLLSAAELRDLGERMAERKRVLASAARASGTVKRAGERLAGAVASMVGLDDELDDEDRGLGGGRRRAAAQRDGGRSPRAAAAARART